MVDGGEQTELGTLGDRRHAQLRRVVRLRGEQAEGGAAAADLGDHVLVLGDQAFELQLRVTLVQFGQARLVARRMVGVG